MQALKIVVTIPTYNEAENIERLVRAILALDEHFEVLVADDNSPDGTAQLVAALADVEPRAHLLLRLADQGRGYAGRDAFVWALEHGADIVFEMDADFSHDPVHLPAMVAALADSDVVLGSRQVPGGQDLGRSIWRVGLTRASNLFVRTVLRLPVRDCNSGYRGFWRHTLERIDVRHAFSSGPAIVHELLFKTHRAGLRIREVPICFRERELGSSTLTFRKLLRSYVNVLRLAWMDLRGELRTSAAAPVSERAPDREQALATTPANTDAPPAALSPRASPTRPADDAAARTK